MAFEKDVYELDSIWSEDWFSEHDKVRIEGITKEILSLKVKSLVDVGCGNGIFLNFLWKNHDARFSRLCGAERSKAAIKHVKTENVLCSIDELPFDDNEFDIVSCQEVIEHLPLGIYHKSLQELARVSNKYIFLSVPYNESLEKSLVSCPSCTTKFNPEYHMRSFHETDFPKMETILGAKLIKYDFIEINEFALLNAITWFYRNQRTIPPHTICPMCGYNENLKIGKNSNKETTGAKGFLKKYWPRTERKRWIYAIFEKPA